MTTLEREATSEDVFVRIVEERRVTTDQLRDRNNPDPRVVRSRQIAVILLGRYWKNPRDEKIAAKLGCSMSFVEQAIRLAAEDTGFQADLAVFGCSNVAESENSGLEEKSVSAQPKQALSSLQKLKLIAKTEFHYEWASLFVNTQTTGVARARRTLMLIGRDYLSMTRDQLAEALNTNVSTVDKAVQVMSDDVDHDAEIRRRVAGICKRHNIEFVRQRARV